MIYVLRIVGLPYIKVGYARDVDRRVASVRQGIPLEVVLMHRSDGERTREQAVLKALRPWRTRGEWFLATKPCCDKLQEILGCMLELPDLDVESIEVLKQKAEICTEEMWRHLWSEITELSDKLNCAMMDLGQFRQRVELLPALHHQRASSLTRKRAVAAKARAAKPIGIGSGSVSSQAVQRQLAAEAKEAIAKAGGDATPSRRPKKI